MYYIFIRRFTSPYRMSAGGDDVVQGLYGDFK